MSSIPRCDVLLLTVTKVEISAVLAAAGVELTLCVKHHGARKTYFDLGVHGGATVYVARSEMASATTGGALTTALDAIAEVRPTAVIMVGIAFGVDSEKQVLGDVLVATQVEDYELQRVGTDTTGGRAIVPRGDRVSTSEVILDRLRAADLGWTQCNVRFGLLISGAKLVDNIDYRNNLLEMCPEAIGGEMEASGVYVACKQQKVDWIIVKAICDWADGEKGTDKLQRQAHAARNAARFVFSTISAGGFTAKGSFPKEDGLGGQVKAAISHLPQPSAYFVGRAEQMQRLRESLHDENTRVIQLIAFGGVGKSTLVANWLRGLAQNGWNGVSRVFGYSFYGQGAPQSVEGTAETFVYEALQFFGDETPEKGSPWNKVQRLSSLIRKQPTLLILDGLEPMQHAAADANCGNLSATSLRLLLGDLAHDMSGLVVITTRLAIQDLVGWEGHSVVREELGTLSDVEGAEFLTELGVTGGKDQLEQASRQVKGHALTLRLLGTYLVKAYAGDVNRLPDIELLKADKSTGSHALQLLRRYERFLGEGPQLALLRLIGLFDRRVTSRELECLAAAEIELTDPLRGTTTADFNVLVANLCDFGLLQRTDAGEIDTHPIIREYFAARINELTSDAGKRAHRWLYDFLKTEAVDLPETADQMLPLVWSIRHAAKAGCLAEAFEDVYWQRIDRNGRQWAWLHLGLYGLSLNVLQEFFDEKWTKVSEELSEDDRRAVLNRTGLAMLGQLHLRDAFEVFRHLTLLAKRKVDLSSTTVNYLNQVQAVLPLGDYNAALEACENGLADFESSATYDLSMGADPKKIGWLYGLTLRFKYAQILLNIGERGLAVRMSSDAAAWFKTVYSNAGELPVSECLIYRSDIVLSQWSRKLWDGGQIQEMAELANLLMKIAAVSEFLARIHHTDDPPLLEYANVNLAHAIALTYAFEVATSTQCDEEALLRAVGVPDLASLQEQTARKVEAALDETSGSGLQLWYVYALQLELKFHRIICCGNAISHHESFSRLNSALIRRMKAAQMIPGQIDCLVEELHTCAQRRERDRGVELVNEIRRLQDGIAKARHYSHGRWNDCEKPSAIETMHRRELVADEADQAIRTTYQRRDAEIEHVARTLGIELSPPTD